MIRCKSVFRMNAGCYRQLTYSMCCRSIIENENMLVCVLCDVVGKTCDNALMHTQDIVKYHFTAVHKEMKYPIHEEKILLSFFLLGECYPEKGSNIYMLFFHMCSVLLVKMVTDLMSPK